MEEVVIYTDGACSGNPGPGGWGSILMYKDNKKEISGGKLDTTNNIMESYASSGSSSGIGGGFSGGGGFSRRRWPRWRRRSLLRK